MRNPTFTILIPTYDHTDTLQFSVASVQSQTRQDFELFIVGDGVPERTREIAAVLIESDPRIRFFDNPKGERHGETHRHTALKEARGRLVCYLSDDDLWFPEHLDRMAELLECYDFAHTMQIEIRPGNSATTRMFDARLKGAIARMRESRAGFGLSCAGHTLEAYQRLPRGWYPAPTRLNTDLHLWLQFLDQPWCEYTSLKWPTLCHLSSATRRNWTISERVAELSLWWPRLLDVNQRYQLIEMAYTPIAEHFFFETRSIDYGRLSSMQRALLKSKFRSLSSRLSVTRRRSIRRLLLVLHRLLKRMLQMTYPRKLEP